MSTEEQLNEYESQLADVDALLQSSPNDESLLSLKKDLMELISITKQQAQPSNTNGFDQALQDAVGNSVGQEKPEAAAPAPAANGSAAPASFEDTLQQAAIDASLMIPAMIETTTFAATAKDAPKKKSSKVKGDFQVPAHLVPVDTDTTAERNRKRRALKALKSKWREGQKEAESAQKQKSWQNFQKKKKLKTTSMFQTSDAAVGVVAAAGRKNSNTQGDSTNTKRHGSST
jgi:survival of motor neuron-related-splicing factor 30